MLIQCPHCEKRYRVSTKALGRKVQCSNPDCQQYFTVSNKPMPTPRDEFLKATHSSWSSGQTFDPIDKGASAAVLTRPPILRPKRVLPPPPPLPNESSKRINNKRRLKVFKQSLLKKRTVIIVSSVIGFVILCLLAPLMIMADKDGNSFFSPYQVEHKFAKSSSPSLEIKVKGPADRLAVMLTNPEGETDIEIIEKEEMMDNIETVRVSMNDSSYKTPEPGVYTLLIKTFEPEKVVYKENLEFELGKLSIENVQIKVKYDERFPSYVFLTVKNEGTLPVRPELFITMGNGKCETRASNIAFPGTSIIRAPVFFRYIEKIDLSRVHGLVSPNPKFGPGTYLVKVKLDLGLQGEKDKCITFEKRVSAPFRRITVDELSSY